MNNITAVASACFLATLASAQSEPAGDALTRHIRELAGEAIYERGSPGVAIGLIANGQRRVHGFGELSTGSERSIDANSVFEIGSITKVVTCLALAMMSSDAGLSLEDPVQKLLPDSVSMPRSEEREILLLDIATHHSGLPRMPTNFKPGDRRNPYADYTVAQMYEFLNDHQLRRGIGEKYEYSNLAMGLLGHALARRDKSSYQGLITARILKPLGMTSTSLKLDKAMRSRLARPHLKNGLDAHNWDIPTLAGAGGLRSSVHDMLTFLQACLSPPNEAFAAALALTMEPRRELGNGRAIGLGWHISGSGEDRWWWHNGATGGYTSYAAFNPVRTAAVVVLRNQQRGGPGPSATKLGREIVDHALAQPR